MCWPAGRDGSLEGVLVMRGVQCLMWLIWKKCNCKAFEGVERPLT